MSAKTKPPEYLLTIAQVAERLKISRETVRRMTDRGACPKPVRLGRAVRYRQVEIETWVGDGCPDLSKRGR